MKIAFHTLGCRLNFSETGSLAQSAQTEGHERVAFGEVADVTLINTCTVTDGADATCRAAIRKAHRFSPRGKIVVVGCYAQTDALALSRIPEVDLVLGTAEKYHFLRHLKRDPPPVHNTHHNRDALFQEAMTGPSQGRTRAFLKIQDGCNYRCSFCIIPRARGPSRWISVDKARRGIVQLVSQGFKEVVLTGVNIGEYGRRGREDLAHLMETLLEVEGLKRLRLSSVEPNTITPELLRVLRSSKTFMPHFHIPLQSGNDEVLKKMRRRYCSGEYEHILGLIKEQFPRASVGADMICGFPGENEEQFEDTYRLAKTSPLTHFHVFPYSPRKETLAANLPHPVDHDIKRARVKRLMALGQEKMYHLMESQIFDPSRVLFEHRDKEGQWWGYTPQYLKVAVTSDRDLKNKILRVLPWARAANHLEGILLGKELRNIP